MNIWTWIALAVVAIGILVLLRIRQRPHGDSGGTRQKQKQQLQALDTVMAWEPHATRILSTQERQAYAILVRALPEYMVLGQVPLSRFLKVPTRHSYAEWVKRVGSLSAVLVVCDRTSEVIAVVEVRSERDSDRARQRHERMERVLKAAHIQVLVWNEGDLPTPASVREALLPEGAPESATAASSTSPLAGRPLEPTPLGAVPGIDLDDDDSGPGDLHEPPPSTWFDDFDQQPTPRK